MTYNKAYIVLNAIKDGKNCSTCAVNEFCKGKDGVFIENIPLCHIAERMARKAVLEKAMEKKGKNENA